MKCHSPSATAISMLIKSITTRMHTSWKMCPLVARDSRLVSAAPLAIIKAAGKDGIVLTTRLARPCRSSIRFLWVIQYAHFGSRGSVASTHRRGVSGLSGLSGFGHGAAYGKDVAGERRRAGEVLDAFWRCQRRHFIAASLLDHIPIDWRRGRHKATEQSEVKAEFAEL